MEANGALERRSSLPQCNPAALCNSAAPGADELIAVLRSRLRALADARDREQTANESLAVQYPTEETLTELVDAIETGPGFAQAAPDLYREELSRCALSGDLPLRPSVAEAGEFTIEVMSPRARRQHDRAASPCSAITADSLGRGRGPVGPSQGRGEAAPHERARRAPSQQGMPLPRAPRCRQALPSVAPNKVGWLLWRMPLRISLRPTWRFGCPTKAAPRALLL
jgi:hypothetical protein